MYARNSRAKPRPPPKYDENGVEKEVLSKKHRDAIDLFMKNIPECVLGPHQKNAPDLFTKEFTTEFLAAIPALPESLHSAAVRHGQRKRTQAVFVLYGNGVKMTAKMARELKKSECEAKKMELMRIQAARQRKAKKGNLIRYYRNRIKSKQGRRTTARKALAVLEARNDSDVEVTIDEDTQNDFDNSIQPEIVGQNGFVLPIPVSLFPVNTPQETVDEGTRLRQGGGQAKGSLGTPATW